MDVKSEAIIKIKEAFDKNDIDIPYPITTLKSDADVSNLIDGGRGKASTPTEGK